MVGRVFALLAAILLLGLPIAAQAQDDSLLAVDSGAVQVMSADRAYDSYLAAPAAEGAYPGIVLIHSFNGLEDGYRTMTDEFAAQGFVVLAVGWQTFERSPSDAVVAQLVQDSVAFLSARDDVDSERLGLTGFCAGGRYTMLLLPQQDVFSAGVAWYGFPYSGDEPPVNFIDQLSAPLLVIHGSADSASRIGDIYRYVTALDAAHKDFELKVYSGEPHGFMLSGGQLRQDPTAQDAFHEMVSYFQRNLA